MLTVIIAMAVVGIGGLVWIIMLLRKGSDSEKKEPKQKKPKKVKPPKVKKPQKVKPPKAKKPKKEKKVKKQKKNKAAKIEAAEEIPQQADIDEDLLDFEPDLDSMGLDVDDELDFDLDTTEAIDEPEIAAATAEPLKPIEIPVSDEIAAEFGDVRQEVPAVEEKKGKTKKVKPPKAKKVKPPKPKKTKKDKSKKSKLPKHVAEAEVIAEADYQLLTERIQRIGKKLRSVLFGGAGIDSLPLTIPVNIAIELSKNGEKCLLIDLDLKRDAIAAAFDIEEDKQPSDFTPKPFDTSFENLTVWPAFNFSKRRYVSVRSLVDAAVNKYDYVLINAPYLDGDVDRSQIGLAAACAFIFTQTPKQTARMHKLLESCNCKIMGNIQVSRQ